MIEGAMDGRGTCGDAVRRLVRDAQERAGGLRALGTAVAAATGRDYRNPENAAGAWASGANMPPGDVVVALLRIFPDLVLDRQEDQVEAATDLTVRRLEREMAQFRREHAFVLAILQEVVIKANLQIDLPGRLEAAGEVDLAEAVLQAAR